ncbi:endospore germination permease [Brevibacillus laterosporus]|uniref:Spore gernimation protein n=1 Tax=Brevibacillus laterosporus TaxID=1465 RepID=A0AAP8U2R2_BRELA|nr:endospore germination permease [Brevibacillus laterosporus]MED1662356.1 endospore germination permease [Brevibacillus laterosporus]MED1670730.1 endospore germination permease [Brevibacillus laterosporus]MED1720200.1 endospore germination permease [Brevibacillus laterosporus]PPA88007.1 spore gernimation protein [Brevibacillus laterosporus]PPA90162.1 spore gernimation protein [Brevibacillus laterosporus]
MRYRDTPITFLQTCCIFFLSAGLLNHVILIPLLLRTVERDGWISILIAMVLTVCWLPLLLFIIRRQKGMKLFSWIKQQSSTWLAWLIIGLLILYLLSDIYVTTLDVTMWTKISYLPQTPVFVVAASMLLLSILCALSGIQPLAICSGVLLPIVILLGYFVMGANFQYKNYSLLLPILENGYLSVFKGAMIIGNGMVEIIFLLMLQHHISTSITFKKAVWLCILLAGLTLGPYMGAIASFGPKEAANQMYPAFEQWRLVTIGKYIEHVDFLSIFQWLSGAFIRVSLALFLIYDVLPIKKRGHQILVTILSGILIVIIILLYTKDPLLIDTFKKIYFPLSLLILLAISLLLALIGSWSKKNARGTDEHAEGN